MTVLPEDLKTYITASTSINAVVSGRVHYNRTPQTSALPHIWLQRQSMNEELTMDGVGGLATTEYIVECASTDISVSYALADKVRARFHGKPFSVGSTTALLCKVTDQDEDYITRSNDADEAIEVAALSLSIWHRT